MKMPIMSRESYCDGSGGRRRTGVHVVTVVVRTDKRRLLQAAAKTYIAERLASVNLENIRGVYLFVKVTKTIF